MKSIFEKLVLGALLGISSAAQAVPVAFEFSIPDWTETDNVPLFGTHGILDVTLDNGSSSILNQTYLNSEITNISLTVAGGSFSHSWTAADGIDQGGASESYISTDGSGIPTLDLLAAQSTTAYFFIDSAFRLHLGVIRPSGGFTTFVVEDSNVFSPFAITVPQDPNTNDFLGFSVIGQQINVSEPATLALLGLAFAGVLARRRRLN